MDDDITTIKSLIAISKGGLLLREIPRQFKEMNGSFLNFQKYGFKSIEELLQSSKDIVLRPSPSGTMCHVIDSKMSHVTSLVNRTSNKSKRKRPKPKSYYNYSRGYSPQPRFGVRQGSISDPNRRPFCPANRMQYDDRRRSAFTRPQAVSRSPTTSSMRQFRQNSCGNSSYQSKHSSANNFERSKKNEPKPLQSTSIGSTVSKTLKTTDESSSGWSSDSSDQPHAGWTSKSAVSKPLSKVETDFKAQAVHEASQVIKGTSATSSSDWSPLDSGSASSLTDVSKKITTHSRINYPSVPLQNGGVSSSIKLPSQLKTKSDSNSDWSDSSGHNKHQSSQSSSACSKPSSSAIPEPPLMVGGVGRGRAYPQLREIRPGMNDADMHRRQSPSNDVIVTGSPCKRETSTTMKGGLSSILVKVRNEPAFSIPKLKKATIVNQKLDVASHQFIGDFLLHRVAEVTLGLKFLGNGGLCHRCLSILDCMNEIQRIRSSRPIILMIGMTDILEGATFDEMKELTTMLLQMLSGRSIVLLTLPVLPSFLKMGFESKLALLEQYNKWLLNLPLPTRIETERYLYCDWPFYTRCSRSEVETFSDAGCWVVFDVIDEIIGATT